MEYRGQSWAWGWWRSPLPVCQWNLNSIGVNVHQLDIFCLTETFLDSLISWKDPRLAIEAYKLFRCDRPSNLWRGGACLYYKDHLPLAIRPNLTTLDKCLVCEIQNGSKRFFIKQLHRSPKSKYKGGRKQSLALMIVFLLLPCILEILMPEI